MIIIPETKTVVLLTPRTGSGSLRRAIAKRYPEAMLLYRHMEADGLPLGYDRWDRVGVVREPIDRLWSLYKFLKTFGLDGPHEYFYAKSMRESVQVPFSEWIVRNERVFTAPYDSAGLNRYYPVYTVRHPLPETRKSQWLTLRPDLGTEILHFDDMGRVAARLNVDLGGARSNTTDLEDRPLLTREALNHVHRYFRWDFEATANMRNAA